MRQRGQLRTCSLVGQQGPQRTIEKSTRTNRFVARLLWIGSSLDGSKMTVLDNEALSDHLLLVKMGSNRKSSLQSSERKDVVVLVCLGL